MSCPVEQVSAPEVAEIRWLAASEVVELMHEAYAIRLLDACSQGRQRFARTTALSWCHRAESLRRPSYR
jgi:hypothetical protein